MEACCAYWARWKWRILESPAPGRKVCGDQATGKAAAPGITMVERALSLEIGIKRTDRAALQEAATASATRAIHESEAINSPIWRSSRGCEVSIPAASDNMRPSP